MANLREVSKATWNANVLPKYEEINTGSLQRIADACELMAQRYANLIDERYADLIDERDRYRRYHTEECKRRAHRENQIRSLKGVITKLRRRLEKGA